MVQMVPPLAEFAVLSAIVLGGIGRAEVQTFLASRYLKLQSESGVLRFRLRRIAFNLVAQILDSAVIPLIGRLGVALPRSASLCRARRQSRGNLLRRA